MSKEIILLGDFNIDLLKPYVRCMCASAVCVYCSLHCINEIVTLLIL